MKKVIAIDGPSGAGKSTVAKLLAKELGYAYLDTGALYRAVALCLRREGLNENVSDDTITFVLEKTRIVFRHDSVFLNHHDVSRDIRTPEASHFASVFSARRPVREYLLDIQREASHHTDLVAEGRDMTTVVFPYAFKKFFLDASVEERVRRRSVELTARGLELDDNKIRMEIIDRDARDSARDIAPLRIADDAVVIDSTGLSVEDVFKKMLAIAQSDSSGGY